ncbi:LipA and NB-ARC domain protein [Metarhizium brunneum]
MEDVPGWNAGPPRRQQTSRAAAAGLHLAATATSPSPLRPSRSLADLRTSTIDEPPLPPLPPRFYNPDLPPSPPPPYEVRRAQSSSALSLDASLIDAAEPDAPPKKKSTLGQRMHFTMTGLINNPVESSSHYSVIRHSWLPVIYNGPDTSVSVTILSDAPLPSNRTLWLRQKGLLGNVGMALQAMMSSRSDWIEVTPAQEAQVKHIPDQKECVIQRDLERFTRKARDKHKRHVPRETHIVRIPAAATDGYYYLVVCGGKDATKVLCRCPVFRVASMSQDAAVVRGASLSTLPLEIGLKVASTVGTLVAKKYIGVAGVVAEKSAGKYMAKQSVKKAATVAVKSYHGLGGPGIQHVVKDSWRRQRAAGPATAGYTTELAVAVIGPDDGPEKPFPVKFEGAVERGTGSSSAELGFPTANLSGVPDAVRTPLSGVFAAWARLLPGGRNVPDGLSPDWHPAVVTIAPPRGAAPTVAPKNGVRVHVLHDFDDVAFFGGKLAVLLMGWLHPAAPPTAYSTDVVAQHALDIGTTLTSLDRDNWSPERTVARIKALKSGRSFSDRLDGVTGKVVQGVDRIPLHRVAVRSQSEAMRDQCFGVGGIWIRRGYL